MKAFWITYQPARWYCWSCVSPFPAANDARARHACSRSAMRGFLSCWCICSCSRIAYCGIKMFMHVYVWSYGHVCMHVCVVMCHVYSHVCFMRACARVCVNYKLMLDAFFPKRSATRCIPELPPQHALR